MSEISHSLHGEPTQDDARKSENEHQEAPPTKIGYPIPNCISEHQNMLTVRMILPILTPTEPIWINLARRLAFDVLLIIWATLGCLNHNGDLRVPDVVNVGDLKN
jgi:hypothetical protein